MFDPTALAALLRLPEGAQPVPAFYDAPMLEEEGWRSRRPLHELLFTDRWEEPAGGAGITQVS